MDIYELREELLENAMKYLDEKFQTQRAFAKMFFKQKLTQGAAVDSYSTYMPQIYVPQEAIDLAKSMETYIMGTNGK